MQQMNLFDDPVAPAGPVVCAPAAPRRPAVVSPPSLSAAKAAAEAGIGRAELGADELMGLARGIVYDVAVGVLPHADGELRRDGLANADDLRYAWQRMNDERVAKGEKPHRWLGNAAGAVFVRNPQVWRKIGMVTSVWPEGHGNPIGQWQLKHLPVE